MFFGLYAVETKCESEFIIFKDSVFTVEIPDCKVLELGVTFRFLYVCLRNDQLCGFKCFLPLETAP
jgi:hypothetical protein